MSVSAPAELRPLDDFLQSDIGDDVSELRHVAEHARNPGAAPWGFGGDSCHVTIGPDDVLVENDFTGQQVSLSRHDFLEVLDDYAAAVSSAREEEPRA